MCCYFAIYSDIGTETRSTDIIYRHIYITNKIFNNKLIGNRLIAVQSQWPS